MHGCHLQLRYGVIMSDYGPVMGLEYELKLELWEDFSLF